MSEIISSIPTGGDIHRRMDRIERLLETLNIELRNMARMEERLSQADTQHHEAIQALRMEVQEASNRVRDIEMQLANSSIITRWGEKIFWAIILLALTLAGHHVLRTQAEDHALSKMGVEHAQPGK